MTLFPKMAILSTAVFVAVAEVVSGALDTASKVGTMGGQALLALLLIVLMWVIWHLEKKRTADREARDKLVTEQYNTLLHHHEKFAQEVSVERGNFHIEMKAHATELRGLTERSIVAMHAMATATDALREYLRDRTPLPPSQQAALRDRQ